MFVLISKDIFLSKEIRNELIKNNLNIAAFKTVDGLQLYEEIHPLAILIDGRENPGQLDNQCKKLKAVFPDSIIVGYFDRPYKSKNVYSRVCGIRREIVSPSPSLAATEFYNYIRCRGLISRPFDNGILKLTESHSKAEFLGFDMSLSKTEYRIIRLFTNYPELEFSKKALLHLCFKDSHIADQNNVSVHISNINKKFIYLGGRQLVISSEGRYRLNPYM